MSWVLGIPTPQSIPHAETSESYTVFGPPIIIRSLASELQFLAVPEVSRQKKLSSKDPTLGNKDDE